MTTQTAAQIAEIVAEARQAAHVAALNYLNTRLGGQDQLMCGFAWAGVSGVKGSTKLGKALMAAGFSKSYSGGLEMWNPSGLPYQNIDMKVEGAKAFVKVVREKIIVPESASFYHDSRLD